MSIKDRWYRWWDPKMLKFSGRIRTLSRRIGRRGSFLLFLSLLDFLYGYSLLTVPGPVSLAPDLFLSYTTWAIAFLVVGAVCLWQAFVRLDRLAFTMAVTLKILWGTTYLISWWLTATNPRGWTAAAIFIGLGIITGIVSYWPEHHKIINGRSAGEG